jgi:hypothetical protein
MRQPRNAIPWIVCPMGFGFPYEVLADLPRTVATPADPNEVLTGVAEAAAGGTAAATQATDSLRETPFEESIEAMMYFCCVAALSEAGPDTAILVTESQRSLTARIVDDVPDEEPLQAIRDRVEAVDGKTSTEENDTKTLVIDLPVARLEPVA